MENNLQEILEHLGVQDPELLENTPKRWAKVLEELLKGRLEKAPDLTVFKAKAGAGEMIVKAGLKAVSLCPHHCLPYLLEADFAYIPVGSLVVGISKPGRLFNWAASRFTLQEEIGPMFLQEFQRQVNPLGSIIVIRGIHLCEGIRGSKQSNSVTATIAVKGVFAEGAAYKREFWKLVEGAHNFTKLSL